MTLLCNMLYNTLLISKYITYQQKHYPCRQGQSKTSELNLKSLHESMKIHKVHCKIKILEFDNISLTSTNY